MAKKTRLDNYVWISDVASILGVSISTVKHRRSYGYYDDIHVIQRPMGPVFNIFDVFKHAHPKASDDTIERLIFEFRQKRTKVKKRGGK